MSYLKVAIFTLILIISVLQGGTAQEKRLKKSEWKEIIEDLRLREKSLLAEREFLKKYLLEFENLDSLLIKLENCRNNQRIGEKIDTLNH